MRLPSPTSERLCPFSQIIEVDGVDTEEHPTDMLTISVAQRYSVLITARNDTSANWRIHANMDADMFDVVPDDLQLSRCPFIRASQ